jgi:hypothetical protein
MPGHVHDKGRIGPEVRDPKAILQPETHSRSTLSHKPKISSARYPATDLTAFEPSSARFAGSAMSGASVSG